MIGVKSKKKNRSVRNSTNIGKRIKSIDIFGEGVGFNIGGEDTQFQTYLGSFLTLAVMVITFTYAFKRYSILREYGDTVHQSSLENYLVTKDDPLKQNQTNLNFMFQMFESYDGKFQPSDYSGYLEVFIV